MGACISISVVYTLRAVLYAVLQHKVIGIDIPTFIKKCVIRMSPPIIITVIIGFAFNRIMVSDRWITLIIKGAFICFVYCVSALLVAVQKSELKKIFTKLKEKIRL